MKKQKIDNYLEFLEKAQKLKNTLRHSWTEDSHRQESVAEHSWHMSLMAVVFSPELVKKVNLTKVLKMISVHDLGEAITGDIPAFSPNHSTKHGEEKEAIKKIAAGLPSVPNKEIVSLYEEYEAKQTAEALFTKMLDVLDVIFQHLIADISTWSEEERTFNLNRKSTGFFEKEPFMFQIYNEIHDRLEEKVKKYTSDPHGVKNERN